MLWYGPTIHFFQPISLASGVFTPIATTNKNKTVASYRGVGRGGSKGSDEPLSNQDLIIASYLGSFSTKPSQV